VRDARTGMSHASIYGKPNRNERDGRNEEKEEQNPKGKKKMMQRKGKECRFEGAKFAKFQKRKTQKLNKTFNFSKKSRKTGMCVVYSLSFKHNVNKCSE
jgi:hypothetical protein